MLSLSTSVVSAKSFNDNFNNGNSNGWLLGNSRGWPTNQGQWSVVDGVLTQTSGYDGVIGLIENEFFSTQTIELDTKLFGPSGGSGTVFWYVDDYNMVYVVLSNGRIEICEWSNNVCSNQYYDVDYNLNENRWVKLKVLANSDTGVVQAYMDGEHLFTHVVATTNRLGLTGVISGNAGAAFDNIILKSKIH